MSFLTLLDKALRDVRHAEALSLRAQKTAPFESRCDLDVAIRATQDASCSLAAAHNELARIVVSHELTQLCSAEVVHKLSSRLRLSSSDKTSHGVSENLNREDESNV